MIDDKKSMDTKNRTQFLINAEVAMQRAALKAREIAKQTGTAVVTSDHNVIREDYPS